MGFIHHLLDGGAWPFEYSQGPQATFSQGYRSHLIPRVLEERQDAALTPQRAAERQLQPLVLRQAADTACVHLGLGQKRGWTWPGGHRRAAQVSVTGGRVGGRGPWAGRGTETISQAWWVGVTGCLGWGD